jgi:transcriptional regulator with XRE-family HTH domain
MELREYMFLNRLSVNQVAKDLECNRCYLSQILNGGVKAGKRLAKDISEYTEGKVTEWEVNKEFNRKKPKKSV